ncbi:MAG TPA: NAD(P)/FAD-dependent oxidoreductase [Anaerolineales bacterium]|nr:NAD(P)/FAD-dependent oxidoreductase [Anaerolineales bacterium]
MNAQRTPHVVIIGAGFGGMEAARKLAGAPIRITLINKENYHLFQPLLYQVAIAGLVPSQIAYPVRTIFRHQKNLSFQMGEVTAIDFNSKFVKMDGSILAYDYLIVAVGGETNFYRLSSIEQNAFQLKNIDSAVETRNHLLRMFEKASREPDPEQRRALLTFGVVGGGPTGVETAGALAELIRLVISKDYPDLDLSDVHVLLLESAAHLMEAYPDSLRKATFDLLVRKHVEICLNTRLVDYDGEKMRLADGEVIPARTLIWTAGVRAAELTDHLGLPQGAGARLVTQQTLQLAGHPEVFLIGDAAYLVDEHGKPLPMLATVAQQEARAAVGNLLRLMKGQPVRPFHYKDPGLLATIGRNAAVARIAGLSFSGFIAWVIWVALHIYRLIGFRNRLVVMINWAWDYFFYDTQVRLITKE